MVGAVGGAGGRPSGLLSVAAAPPMTSPVATLANCFVQHPNTHCSPASLRLCCKIFNIKILHLLSRHSLVSQPGYTGGFYQRNKRGAFVVGYRNKHTHLHVAKLPKRACVFVP